MSLLFQISNPIIRCCSWTYDSYQIWLSSLFLQLVVALHLPLLDNWLLGSVIGPGGFSFVSEMVQIEPICNIFAALFLDSIGMLIHVHFLWDYIDILLASVILVVTIKTIIITMVVKGFGYNSKTSVLIGEFVFVLLSHASNLHLVEGKLYLLLLGTTALSLVTTPLLFKLIPFVVHLVVLLRWFSPDSLMEIGFKGDSLRIDSGKQRVTLIPISMPQEPHDS